MMMSEDTQEKQSPMATRLPEPPDTSFYGEAQWKVWYALLDTVVPSIVPCNKKREIRSIEEYNIPQGVFDDICHDTTAMDRLPHPPGLRQSIEDYMSERASDTQALRDHSARILADLPEHKRSSLGVVLSLLSIRVVNFFLSGYYQPFYAVPVVSREKVIRQWQRSSFSIFRGLARSFSALGKKLWIQTSPQFRQHSGWTDLPKNHVPGASDDLKFREFQSPSNDMEYLETDVVIVGSGCGGGVCATVLSEAGYRVTVVDKGHHFPSSAFPMSQTAADINLMENKGVVSNDDASVAILAGSCWGGGGTINWGVSLETPGYVRQEWAEDRGLSHFASSDYQDSIRRVCDFMGVSDATVRQNHRGRVLLDGAQKLGWAAKPVPHNSARKEHDCGHCHLGCGSNTKQGPATSWLPAAAKTGAEFIEGFHVERVTFDDIPHGRKASGVVGKWTSRRKDCKPTDESEDIVTRDITIKAKRVILACGTLWSPVILENSGLTNPHIGKNLYLHPLNILGAFWKEEVKPWEGCATTAVVTAFENMDGRGHGVKLEPCCMVPTLALAHFPWRGGLDFKRSALKYKRLDTFFSMSRDRDTGSVYPDPVTKSPRVKYSPSEFDRCNVREGLVALARICYTMGAEEIVPYLNGIEPFVRTTGPKALYKEDAEFESWLARLRVAENSDTEAWGSAHQMGSCRMSQFESDGVVDAMGEVWGAEGLHIADASVFPSASGVNPMVTIMAIADTIARGIAVKLR